MLSTSLVLAAVLSVQPNLVRPGANVKIVYRNDEFAGKPVKAHVGFNGYQGATRDLPMRQTANGFEADLAVPADSRAIHVTFCKNSCGAGDWDNNDGKDYGWPVVFPFIGPVLTWNERTPPESGIVVSFETGVPMAGYVEYGVAGGARRRVESPSQLSHHVALTGLAPDTRYEYRVGSANGHVSETSYFKTAPSAAALDRARFVVFGDAQDDGTGRWAEIARTLATREADADFVISTGDLPANDNPGAWWTFFDKGRPLLASKVVMPALGNHDTPTKDSSPDHSSFVRYWSLPGITKDRPFYKFRFGPAEFFGMNSERPNEFATGGVQYRWIRDQLASRGTETWRFAYWHIPPFNAGVRHYQQQGVSRDLAGLFDGKVDWQFGGHEHVYQRTKPLRDADGTPRIANRYGTDESDGVGYLIVPASGTEGMTEFRPRSDHPESRERLAFPDLQDSATRVASWIGYSRVEVTGPRFKLQTVQIDEGGRAHVVDEASYSK